MSINNTVSNVFGQSKLKSALGGSSPTQSALSNRIAAPQSNGVNLQQAFSSGGLSAPVSAPIKKQVHANSDGSSITTHYDTSNAKSNTGTGLVDPAKVQGVSGLIDPRASMINVNPNESMQEVKGGSVGTKVDNQYNATDGSGNSVQIGNPALNPEYNYNGGTPNNPPQTPQDTSYPGLIKGLASFNPLANPAVAGAYKKAQDLNTQIEQSKTNQANAEAENRLNPIPIGDQTGREAVIRNQYLAQQGALASQFQGQSSLYGAGLTGTNQSLSGLSTAAGLTPEILRYGGANGGSMTAEEATAYKAKLNSIGDFTTKYIAGQANLRAADSIQNQIVNTLNSNPTLNKTKVSELTNIAELISGQVSSGPQQLLSQQIAQYIAQLGLDPATVTNIAHQQSGTLADLLDSLRTTAQAQNDAYNPANIKTQGGSTPSTTGAGSWTSASGKTYNNLPNQ